MIQKIISNRINLVLIIPFLLGLLTVFSFAPFNYFFLNFIIFPIFFLILCYVNKKSKNKYRKKPYLINLFFIGYFFGVGFFLSGTHWISYSLTFDENFKILIPISLILLPLFLGLFFGLTTLLVGPYIRENLASILIFSSAFSFSDFIRSKILTGFPWNLWSYSFSNFIEFLQILNLIGFFAFNLFIITSFCIPLLLFFKNNKKLNMIFSIFWLILIFSNYIYGSATINSNKYLKINNSVNIKIVNPNFDLNYNLQLEQVENLFKRLVKYSDPKTEKETIFIWPEGVFAGYELSELYRFKKIIRDNFSSKHKIIFGINTKDNKSNGYFNSLVAIDNNFKVIYKYNKKKLVPFGEFLPFENLLHKIGLKKITQGHGSFTKGKINNNYQINKLNILPLICYEIIFPDFIQKAEPTTNLIINISEDAWFGNSIGPQQHFAKAIFRSIEGNLYLARSANKGTSAFINNKGQVLKKLNSSEPGSIEMSIPVVKNKIKNKNDLIFFILLFTYTSIFFTLRKKL